MSAPFGASNGALAAVAASAALAAAFLPSEPLDAIYFAGGGGSSQGYEEALGKHPDIALNHNEFAIGVHQHNFPATEHLIADVFDVDPRSLRPGQHFRSWWFSPDCRHHSPAKGGALLDTGVRGLAWVIIKVAKLLGDKAPDVIFLENVIQWRDWGPLYREGQVVDGAPLRAGDRRIGRVIPERKGEIYRLFCRRMAQCGYVSEDRDLVACDYGDPTTRKRMFKVWRRDGMPICWPRPTHAPPSLAAKKGLKPYRTALDILDLTVDVPSIFGRKKRLAPKTEARVAKGIRKFVIEAEKPVIIRRGSGGEAPTIVNAEQNGANGLNVRPVTDPIRTLTQTGGFAVGSATLQAPAIVELAHGDDHKTGERIRPVGAPLRTIHAGGGNHSLAAAFLEQSNTRDIGGAADAPVRSVPTKLHQGVTAAFLGRQFGSTISGRSLDEPHPAVMTDGAGGKSQVVVAHLTKFSENSIGIRPDEPLHAVMAGAPRHGLVATTIDKYYASGVAQATDRPIDTATSKARFGLNAAYLEQAGSDSIGHAATDPVSTICQAGCHQRLVSAGLVPAGDLDGSSRRARVVAFLWEHFGEPTAEEWSDPAGTVEARVKFGLVVVDGALWQIVDIGMRMLLPRELARAMGWPDSFETGVSAIHGKISKTREIALIGNGVCRNTAGALIRENLGPGRWIAPEERERMGRMAA